MMRVLFICGRTEVSGASKTIKVECGTGRGQRTVRLAYCVQKTREPEQTILRRKTSAAWDNYPACKDLNTSMSQSDTSGA